jgi:hypothetical protein
MSATHKLRGIERLTWAREQLQRAEKAGHDAEVARRLRPALPLPGSIGTAPACMVIKTQTQAAGAWCKKPPIGSEPL